MISSKLFLWLPSLGLGCFGNLKEPRNLPSQNFENFRMADPTIPSWYVMICPSSFHLVSIYFLYMFYINVPWLPSFPIPHRIVSPGWLLPPWSQPCLCCTNSCGPSRDPSVAAAIRISRAPWIRDLEVVSGGRGLCREPTGQLIQIYIYIHTYI